MTDTMDSLSALRLQLEWGADEALQETPRNRFTQAPTPGIAGVPPARPTNNTPSPSRPTAPTPALQTIQDLPALHAALDAFQACPLRGTASTTVAPSGNPAAGLLFLAEAPAADDDRSGQAFSGALGQTLDRVLHSAGLSRDLLLLAFLVPWRPPGGRQLNETEIALCLPFVHRLLAITRPRRIVLLGGWPLRALAHDPGGIRQARGRWTEVAQPDATTPDSPIPALPMLPPELWLKTPANRQNTWNDLLLLQTT